MANSSMVSLGIYYLYTAPEDPQYRFKEDLRKHILLPVTKYLVNGYEGYMQNEKIPLWLEKRHRQLQEKFEQRPRAPFVSSFFNTKNANLEDVDASPGKMMKGTLPEIIAALVSCGILVSAGAIFPRRIVRKVALIPKTSDPNVPMHLRYEFAEIQTYGAYGLSKSGHRIQVPIKQITHTVTRSADRPCVVFKYNGYLMPFYAEKNGAEFAPEVYDYFFALDRRI